MLIGLGILDVALTVWTLPNESPWGVPLASAFFLLLLGVVLLGRADQALGREIQAAGGDPPASPVEQPGPTPAASDVRAIPAFSIEVLTTHSLPRQSSDAARLVARGRRHYSQRLRIYRDGVWLLGLAHLAIVLLGRALDRPYPIRLVVGFWLLVVTVALIAFCRPAKMRLILVPFAWWIVSFAWAVLTLAVAAIFSARAVSNDDRWSALLAFIATFAVVGHALWLRRRNRDLRRTVMADPPLKLLFLWVFGSFTPAFLFLGFAAVWRFLGRIQLLNGAGFMGDSLEIAAAFARGKSGDLVVKTPEQLAARMAAFDSAPGSMAMYTHHSLLCHDSVWKRALDAVLEDTHVILMDLRGFSREHQGATYELSRLVDSVSAGRFVLLADDTTDAEFLSATLHRSWEAMALDSPNRSSSQAIRVFNLGRASTKQGDFPQLPAIAREGDRLLEIVCECAVAPNRDCVAASERVDMSGRAEARSP
jgi:hypothetical protein